MLYSEPDDDSDEENLDDSSQNNLQRVRREENKQFSQVSIKLLLTKVIYLLESRAVLGIYPGTDPISRRGVGFLQ